MAVFLEEGVELVEEPFFDDLWVEFEVSCC
jgi:hypothetical protein